MIISYAQIEVFMLILARVIGIFIAAPLFSTRSFATPAKTALAVWLSIVLWFVVPVDMEKLPITAMTFFLAMIAEVAIGFLIGFITDLIFLGIQAAGEIIDLQMGLSVAASFDPIFGSSISIIGRTFFYIAITIFVMADGHHMILSALHQSFRLLPVGGGANFTSPMLASQIMGLVQTFWLITIKLSAPIILIIFLSDFAFGIVSRVAPQVNVFQLGFQVKPSLGLLGIVFIMPLLVKHISDLIGTMAAELLKLFSALRII